MQETLSPYQSTNLGWKVPLVEKNINEKYSSGKFQTCVLQGGNKIDACVWKAKAPLAETSSSSISAHRIYLITQLAELLLDEGVLLYDFLMQVDVAFLFKGRFLFIAFPTLWENILSK